MIEGGFRAMGTTVIVRTDREGSIEAARRLFAEVEQVCSRFRADSELIRVNRHTGTAAPLSPLLLEVVEAADSARHATDGLVDIGVGRAVSDWGYDRTFYEVEDLPKPPGHRDRPSWMLKGGSIHRAPGTEIDLGGIAKGWTCDRVVESGTASVASAGGDIRSSEATTIVEILDPWSEPAVTVVLGVGALATSSVTRRRWRVGGRDVHHVIDPRTGRPAASPILSASALTETAAEAEAAAKAVLLKGADGLAWAEDQSWIRGAVAVWEDGSVYATTGLEVAA